MKKKAVFINSSNRSVEAIESVGVFGLEDLQSIIAGPIEQACVLDTGDVCFIDAEGMLKNAAHFFVFIDGSGEMPYAGNGLIVGPCDENGDITDCLYSVSDIEKRIQFMTRAEVIGWLNENRAYDRVGGFLRMI